MKNSLVIILIICLYSQISAYINPEIKDAVRKSHPDKLELLLNKHKLTEDEKSNLLGQAKEILKINYDKINENDHYLKKKKARYIKLYLSGTLGLASSICVPVGIISLLKGEVQSDIPSYIGGIAILGLIGAGLLKYDIYLYNKIKKSRSNKQKYLDATEVEQILSRPSA